MYEMSTHNTLQLVNNRLMHAHHENTFPAMYAAEFGNVLKSERMIGNTTYIELV